jgi:voltage-gated potassium channel
MHEAEPGNFASQQKLFDGPIESGPSARQRMLFSVIFKADTPAGKLFDVVLIIAILVSVVAVMLGSVPAIQATWGSFFYYGEWIFTLLFTFEYLVRLYCVRNRTRYARSFFGVVDLLSVAPLFLELIVTGAGHLLVIRILRILRLFRILKLSRYVGEADAMMQAMFASRRKILVFLYVVLTLVVLFGSLMYLIEGKESGFTSIPRSIYWAIVTLTTVGYGDITPQTPLGQAISAIVMICGYGIIAVPTGIYASELAHVIQRGRRAKKCSGCGLDEHAEDSAYCRRCGTALPTDQTA